MLIMWYSFSIDSYYMILYYDVNMVSKTDFQIYLEVI